MRKKIPPQVNQEPKSAQELIAIWERCKKGDGFNCCWCPYSAKEKWNITDLCIKRLLADVMNTFSPSEKGKKHDKLGEIEKDILGIQFDVSRVQRSLESQKESNSYEINRTRRGRLWITVGTALAAVSSIATLIAIIAGGVA